MALPSAAVGRLSVRQTVDRNGAANRVSWTLPCEMSSSLMQRTGWAVGDLGTILHTGPETVDTASSIIEVNTGWNIVSVPSSRRSIQEFALPQCHQQRICLRRWLHCQRYPRIRAGILAEVPGCANHRDGRDVARRGDDRCGGGLEPGGVVELRDQCGRRRFDPRGDRHLGVLPLRRVLHSESGDRPGEGVLGEGHGARRAPVIVGRVHFPQPQGSRIDDQGRSRHRRPTVPEIRLRLPPVRSRLRRTPRTRSTLRRRSATRCPRGAASRWWSMTCWGGGWPFWPRGSGKPASTSCGGRVRACRAGSTSTGSWRPGSAKR